jgi:hypothetical protein
MRHIKCVESLPEHREIERMKNEASSQSIPPETFSNDWGHSFQEIVSRRFTPYLLYSYLQGGMVPVLGLQEEFPTHHLPSDQQNLGSLTNELKTQAPTTTKCRKNIHWRGDVENVEQRNAHPQRDFLKKDTSASNFYVEIISLTIPPLLHSAFDADLGYCQNVLPLLYREAKISVFIHFLIN